MLFHANPTPSTVNLAMSATYFLFAFWLGILTYGLPIPSGLFVPSIMSGAAYGRFFGELLGLYAPGYSTTPPGNFALIGAAAMLGGISRMTVSITVIVLECTTNITYLLPIALAIMVAKLVGDLFNQASAARQQRMSAHRPAANSVTGLQAPLLFLAPQPIARRRCRLALPALPHTPRMRGGTQPGLQVRHRGHIVRIRGQQRWTHHVDDNAAYRQCRVFEFGDPIDGFLNGHLFQNGDEVHRGPIRSKNSHDAVGLLADGSDLGDTGNLGVDVEEPRYASGGWGVKNNGVVRRAVALVASAYEFYGLAGQEDIAQTGRDSGDELDGAHLSQDPTCSFEVVEQVQVVQECRLGVDRQSPQLATTGDGDQPPLFVGQRRAVKHLGEALPALNLHHQNPTSIPRQRQGASEDSKEERVASRDPSGDGAPSP